MTDFLNSVKDNLSSVGDPNKVLTGNVDKQRTIFLKGLKSTTSGQKEDPTYTGFRIMFDFGYGGAVDPETYLPTSPLLCKDGSTSVPITSPRGMKLAGGIDFFNASRQIMFPTPSFPNYTENMHYMTAEAYLRERRSAAENVAAENVAAENVAPGAPTRDSSGKVIKRDASQKDSKGNYAHRADALVGFRNLLNGINEKSPWFIQSIDGLDKILQVTPPRQVGPTNTGYKEQRSGILTFDCIDSIDLRVNAMAELYRKATYDYQYHREALPTNLRKFRMYIIVTEIRQIDLHNNLVDVLNPFKISGVASAVNSLRDIAQSSGLFGKGNPSTANADSSKTQDDVNKLVDTLSPYILIYQLDLCEFNFDESYAFNKLTNTRGESAVSNKFKVHVGSAKEYKLQYNILSDLLQNSSIFAPILIHDSWNLDGSTLNIGNITADNNVSLFNNMAKNFINNSVASVVQQKISPIVSRALLGNAYGFNVSQVVNAATNSLDGLLGAVKNTPSPFQDHKPQSRGFGGPGERQYPTINEDVYPTVPGLPGGTPGNVYPQTPNNNVLTPNDIYPNDPGSDLGLPGRIYRTIKTDEYKGDPGKDLGVPDRIYPSMKEDVYPNDPGKDLGLPGRVYPNIKNDQYPTVPENIKNIYPSIKADVYPNDPGKDLGLPNRIYHTIKNDQYPTDPGKDLGAPDRVYPVVNDDVYPPEDRIIEKIPPGSILDATRATKKLEPYAVYPQTEKRNYPSIQENVYKKG